MDSVAASSQPEASTRSAAGAARLRAVAVSVLAGFLSGLVALGIGCRLAMRIVALLASDADQGTLTDADAVVGEISVGGTVFLVLLGGAAGTFGGLLYGAMRRRLAWCGSFRGVAFGLIAVVLFGSVLIKGSNPDFARLGAPLINVAMFASLFVFFGALIAPVYDSLDAAVPYASRSIIRYALTLAQTAGLLLMVPATAIVAAIFIGDGGDTAIEGLMVLGVFVYLVIAAGSPAPGAA